MSDVGAKQQIVDKIKNNTNILVTVSNDPSVDELSAALGLTLLLNKMKKHATAVFSGQLPPSINFLDPAKTFESTVDSLRDFIIALDKEKADHLRYKIEGDVVKIFITPYRTTITSDDLDFSQGDYNVEMVLALGVNNQENLDKALEAHGRILHDATVATITAGTEKSQLGSIDWREETASSLSEMMVSLSEALKADKTLLDEQIATAFLAGIVAATERFSNNRTSARVMTMAAQLMGAGANQQLIASKFEEASGGSDDSGTTEASAAPASTDTNDDAVKNDTDDAAASHSDGTTDLSEGESTKLDRTEEEKEAESAKDDEADDRKDGTLNVSHEKEGTIDEVAEQTAAEEQADAAKAAEAELAKQAKAVEAKNQADATASAEEELASQLPPVVAPKPGDLSVADLQKDIATASADVAAAADVPLKGAVSSDVWKNAAEPTFGGTLNATTEQAEEEARKAEEADRNRTILSHGNYIGDTPPAYSAPFNAASLPPEEPSIVNPMEDQGPSSGAAPSVLQIPTLADLDRQNRTPNLGAPGPELLPLPPLPDFSTLPPLPAVPGAESSGTVEPASPVQPPAPAAPQDPAQFRIPGNPAA
jgi:hypothetical protein